MTGQIWLGIDVGTQGVRVLAVDDDGHLVGYGFAALTSVRSRQRHQQNPEHWWHAVVKAANAALTGVDIDAIAGLAVDATSGTILLADPAGHPRTDALMYDDGRAPDQALYIGDNIDDALAAQAARVPFLGILPKTGEERRQRSTRLRELGAVAILNDISQLEPWLRKLRPV